MDAIETVTSHRLSLDQRDSVVDVDTSQPFDLENYSRMKYGDRKVTQDFAGKLTTLLVESRPSLIEDDIPPQFITAYQAVPHVPFYLCRYSLDIINHARITSGNEPARLVKVSKSRTAVTNYAAASEKDRDDEWASIDFSFEGHPVSEAQSVILDDIRITGSAERKILSVFGDRSAQLMMLGYVAVLNQQKATERPNIEDYINGTANMKIENLEASIKSGNFDLNIRTLKMILSTEPNILMTFLSEYPRGLVEEMMRGVHNSGPDFARYYAQGYRCLQLTLQE